MRRNVLLVSCTLLAALCSVPAAAEYCLDLPPGTYTDYRENGSTRTRGCTATEPECQYHYRENPSHYASRCYYVPGAYPPTPAAKTSSGPDAAVDAAASAAEQQRNAAREAERQQQFARDKAALISRMKMDEDSAARRPAATQARSQLDCIARESASGDPRGGNWENARDCTPLATPVPAVPAPVAEDPLPADPEQLGRLLSELATRISSKRSEIAEQDREIAAQEKIVASEQLPPPVGGLKPAADSDALRRAREALARAKAARAQADRELQDLQKKEQEAKNAQ